MSRHIVPAVLGSLATQSGALPVSDTYAEWAVYPGEDYPGADIGGSSPNKRGLPNPRDCAKLCAENDQCSAVVYAHDHGGAFSGITRGDCWLKSGTAPSKSKKPKEFVTYAEKPTGNKIEDTVGAAEIDVFQPSHDSCTSQILKGNLAYADTPLAKVITQWIQLARNSSKTTGCKASEVWQKDILSDIIDTLGLQDFAEKYGLIEAMMKTNPVEWFQKLLNGVSQNEPLQTLAQSILEGRVGASRRMEDADNVDVPEVTLHYMLFLDSMANVLMEHEGTAAMTDLINTFKSTRDAKNLTRHLTTFGRIKLKSVEPIMKIFGAVDKHTLKENTEGTRNSEQTWRLRVNILEATTTEGPTDNARAGNVMVTEANKEWFDSPHFQRLYESWNLAFVTSQYAEAPLFWTKLLTPAVTSAEPEHYMYQRVNALFIHVHMVMGLRERFEHRTADTETQGGLSSSRLMAAYKGMLRSPWNEDIQLLEKWGNLNFKYAVTPPENDVLQGGLKVWKDAIAASSGLSHVWSRLKAVKRSLANAFSPGTKIPTGILTEEDLLHAHRHIVLPKK